MSVHELGAETLSGDGDRGGRWWWRWAGAGDVEAETGVAETGVNLVAGEQGMGGDGGAGCRWWWGSGGDGRAVVVVLVGVVVFVVAVGLASGQGDSVQLHHGDFAQHTTSP